MLGFKFRRQYGIDAFVVDFYCPSIKLAIEIDGDIHLSSDVNANDLVRQQYLEQFGISFLRFSNEEILENIESVLDIIEGKLREFKKYNI